MGAVRLYQWLLAPLIPLLFGPTGGCRFQPTCSHYALEALRVHGLFGGLYLTARRLLRCHPFHSGGDDPVPATLHFGPAIRPFGRGDRCAHRGARLSCRRRLRTHG
jgi:uncharacterized protein